MEFTFNCPECSQSVVVDEASRGQSHICPHCDQSIVVPEFDVDDPDDAYDAERWNEYRPQKGLTTFVSGMTIGLLLLEAGLAVGFADRVHLIGQVQAG